MSTLHKLTFVAFVALSIAPLACGSEEFSVADAPVAGSGGDGGTGPADASADSTTGGAAGASTGGTSGSAGDGGSGGTVVDGGAASGGASGAAGSDGGGNAGIGGSAGAAGVGGSPVEDCLNGIDDDANGETDCADSACQAGYACVPSPPQGWFGVGWIRPQMDPCPAELPNPVDLFDAAGLSVPPLTCECRCEAPGGVQCSTHAGCWPSANECNNNDPDKGTGTQCATNVPTINAGTAWCKAAQPGAWGGSCARNALATTSPWTWNPAARACLRPAGGACPGAGEVCVPRLPASTGRACVVKSGDVGCPPSLPAKAVYYDGTATDNRSCNAAGCTCGAPIGSTCDCTGAGCRVELYGNATCGGAPSVFPADGSCTQVQSPVALSSKLANAVVGAPGSCAPSGAATQVDSVEPSSPITVCCVP